MFEPLRSAFADIAAIPSQGGFRAHALFYGVEQSLLALGSPLLTGVTMVGLSPLGTLLVHASHENVQTHISKIISLSALDIPLFAALVGRMRSASADEMQSWLRQFCEESGIGLLCVPSTKTVFAPWVAAVYEYQWLISSQGALGRL